MLNLIEDNLITLQSMISEPIYVVGGAIRDLLIYGEKKSTDVDLVTEKNITHTLSEIAINLNASFKNNPNFGTAKLIFNESDDLKRFEIDFATAREETYSSSGALPNVKFSSLDQDFKRRDFTINTLAVSLNTYISYKKELKEIFVSNIIDKVSGVADIESKIIRILHSNSFYDDPTRIFRAFRYSGRFNFSIESETFQLILEGIDKNFLNNISDFRSFQEIRHIMAENCWKQIFNSLINLKIKNTYLYKIREQDLALVDTSSGLTRFLSFLAIIIKNNHLVATDLFNRLSLVKSERELMKRYL
jgi:tRNA nucleotidyltransferase (CCA-adding enzyme)